MDALSEQVQAETHKFSKAEVHFGPAKGPDHCGDCKYFEVYRKQACKIVAGIIYSNEWCNRFIRELGKED